MKLLMAILFIAFFGMPTENRSDELRDSISDKSPSGIWAINLRVKNLNDAVKFYVDILEFEVLEENSNSKTVALKNEGVGIYLTEVKSRSTWDYDVGCRMNFNLYVEDLDSYMEKFKLAEIHIIDDTVLTAGVGKYYKIADPSGNPINVMQLGYEHEPVSKPTLYNVSAVVTKMDMARDFYEDLLGFEVLSERYYPPVIPYKPRNVQLILHEGGTKKSKAPYPHGSQTNLILIVDNLDSALQSLGHAGYDALLNEHTEKPEGLLNAVRDPDGNVIELLEYK